MKIDVLQHVHFEELGLIREWGEARGAVFNVHKLFNGVRLPAAEEVDFLIILGGPMSVNDSEISWLAEERLLIRQMIEQNKPIIGICLGAQQLAKVLGGKVFQGKHKEVGWFPVKTESPVFPFVPKELTVFHWHGEQFELPEGSVRLFSNEVCENQGFLFHQNVIGLQFHLESTNDAIKAMLLHDGDYLDGTTYVQDAADIEQYPTPEAAKAVLFGLLDHLLLSVSAKAE